MSSRQFLLTCRSLGCGLVEIGHEWIVTRPVRNNRTAKEKVNITLAVWNTRSGSWLVDGQDPVVCRDYDRAIELLHAAVSSSPRSVKMICRGNEVHRERSLKRKPSPHVPPTAGGRRKGHRVIRGVQSLYEQA